MKRLRPALLGVALLLAACADVPPPAVPPGFEPIAADAQVAAMGRGVNVLGYDEGWGDPAKFRFKPRAFRQIRLAGFSNVRIVLQTFEHMDGDNRLPPQWMASLDAMVGAALDAGLTVILDEHDLMSCAADVEACRVKLPAFWSQVALRYRNAPNKVMFELLNEPHDQLTPERWNVLLAETLATVRQSNPTRTVVVGPGGWNGMEELPALKLPENDRHIVVTFHYYHPFHFTHQGATWAGGMKDVRDVHWGEPADYRLIDKEFDQVKAWGVTNRRPILLGEFGAFDPGPLPDRVKWTQAVARSAEAHGFAWTYWYFDGGFGVFDSDRGRWIEPILGALIPKQ
jgi:endoglucanase